MNYQRQWVIAAYRAAHPNKLDPDEDALEDFDESLFDEYDSELVSQATADGLGTSTSVLSPLVFFATQSSAKGIGTRVKHAIKFYNAAQP